MSIWDQIKRGSGGGESNPASSGQFFTIQFGTEQVNVSLEPGMSLKSAMDRHAQFLGYDGSRAVTWREGNAVVSESTTPRHGATYMASVSLETKGRPRVAA